MNLTKFFIDQHGCAKNQVDGEIIINRLVALGLEQTFEPAEASLIIINSCGFIESAKKESLDALCAARQMYPRAKILLTGCLAERYADVFKDELLEADGIFGNGDLSKIDEIISPLLKGQRQVLTSPQKGVCCGERKMFLSFKGSAFIKITEGCSNHCSFCAIPLIRGELRSRKVSDIIEEIKSLYAKGIVEFNLIGQDLAAYGTGIDDDVFGTGRFSLPKINENGENIGTSKKSALCLLLEEISKISGNFFVRLLYIHPDHFNRDILEPIIKDSRFLHYFDIPFQSGSDKIIKSMNRKGTSAEYLRLISDIREKIPDVVIRTTFLAGFPGETDEDAQKTLDFLVQLKSSWSGCFPYSREEDTPAYFMKKRVPAKIAVCRGKQLSEAQGKLTSQFLSSMVGKEFDVLVEEVVEGDEGLAIGRAWFQAPDVDGSVVVRYEKDDERQNSFVQNGRFVRVRISSASDVDLDGIFICDSNFNGKIVDSDLKFATEIRK